MRWRDPAAALGGAIGLAALAGVLLTGAPGASAGGEAGLVAGPAGDVREAGGKERRAIGADQLATVERTIDLLAERERSHRERLTARARAYYKLERSGLSRLWLEPGARRPWLARRAAAARILRRDLRELAVLRAERDAAVRARDRARAGLSSREPVAAPAPRSLVWPVPGARVTAGFGEVRDRASGARLARRGIELAVSPGAPVRAVAAGRVEWVGPLAGATGIIVDHGPAGFVSVLVGDQRPAVVVGQEVEAGEALAEATGAALHLEIRLRTGVFGHPIDPRPLLGR